MILISGGAGFVGSHTVKHWLETHPHEQVLMWDNFSTGRAETFSAFDDRVIVRTTHLQDPEAMAHWMRHFQVDTVLHCAASSRITPCNEAPIPSYHQNVTATLHLVDAMMRARVRRLVFASSGSLYGAAKTHVPLCENQALRPINVYGASKAMAELALQGITRTQPMQVLALRYFNVAGAAPDGTLGEHPVAPAHLIPRLFAALSDPVPPPLDLARASQPTPDGFCVRDFVHVWDIARANVAAIERLRQPERAFPEPFYAINLGSGLGSSVAQVAHGAQALAGTAIPCRERGADPVEASWLVADVTRAQKWLDWSPQYSLHDILTHGWHWHQSQMAGRGSLLLHN